MNKIKGFFLVVFLLAGHLLTAQVLINDNYNNNEEPDGSAILDLKSTDKGLLLPRLTVSQIRTIADPSAGLIVFNTDSTEINLFDGMNWVKMTGDKAFLTIGDTYQGGIIAYIFQDGDPGYTEGEFHGLVVAPDDQSTGATWYNGTFLETGATATALETGYSNTIAIIGIQGNSGSYAAKLCRDYNGGGYTDWYLPSKDELSKLYDLKVLGFGGFSNAYYWSSSENAKLSAWCQNFYGNLPVQQLKSSVYHVRAVRDF